MDQWSYLKGEPFQVRQAIAAHFLQDCPHVIEIGGYKTPVTHALKHDYELSLCVDPLLEPHTSQKVIHLAADYRDIDFREVTKNPYGLVLLGADLPFDLKLLELILMARKVIFEYSPDHLPAEALFKLLEKEISFRTLAQIDLDLSPNRYGKRRLLVLTGIISKS